MKKLLIIKTGAAGDVIRTTSVLHKFLNWNITWFVSSINKELLNTNYINKIITQANDFGSNNYFDFIISLEDDLELLIEIFGKVRYGKIFGALVKDGKLDYTNDSEPWFDMSLISKYGIKKANEFKLNNRLSYQEIIFNSLGFKFDNSTYILPEIKMSSNLKGDIAVAPFAGKRWPSKNWYYFDLLIKLLSKDFSVNILPKRDTLNEHIADIKNHNVIISNDSLPMHIALGMNKITFAFFLCTSPWEIYDYGRLYKFISPKITDYFYITNYEEELVKSISVDEVYKKIISVIKNQANL